MKVFLYGTLRHLPLLAVVLGREVEVEAAVLPGWRTVWARDQGFPLIVAGTGDGAAGLLIDADDRDRARLDFYETGFGYDLAPVTVEGRDGTVAARVYLPRPGLWQAGADWSLGDWVDRWGGLVTAAAAEFMQLWPATGAEIAAGMYPQILQRVSSRQRAEADPMPRGIRRGGGAVDVITRNVPWRGFFEIEESTLRFPRFDGTLGPEVRRAAFVGGDAVTVLPYDPVRDRVLVVEQFRFGPLVRGDVLPWSVEPVAGRIDGGETPEAAARRETLEEAGLTLGRLIFIGRYYPSPGAVTEYLYSYIALCDLPDGCAGLGGLEEEAEDIRATLLTFDALMALVDAREMENAPLLISALELARMRDRLRA